jgi:UDP-GlcNAc:undecaprenyl-phosphate/decaprenyl-phosphate GlcNAc-1-phosphate transferase
MDWVAVAVSLAAALIVVPAGAWALESAGLERPNYRGRSVASPLGAVLLAASLLALATVTALDATAGVDRPGPDLDRWLMFVVVVVLLGLIDDALGGGPSLPRGLGGHARAALHGGRSTGAIKAIGTVTAAAYALAALGLGSSEYVLEAAVLVLSVHAGNLLDLRPGRAEKVLVLILTALCIVYKTFDPVELLSVFMAPVLVGAWFTLRERAMLGDAGASLVGALIGIALVTTLSGAGLCAALAILAAVTIFGEFRSISAAIERLPLLKHLDSLGRAQ